MAFFKNKIIGRSGDKKAGAEHRPVGSPLQNPKILEVNLIKDEARVVFDWPRNLLMMGIVIALGALLAGETYWILDRWEEQEKLRLQPLIEETDRLNAETVRLRNESAAALSYQEKSAVFSELLDNHVYWSGLFSWLEKNTLSTVRYEAFKGDLNGKYELQATASSFSDASWQAKQLLADPVVASVEIKQVSSMKREDEKAESSGVMFTLAIQLKPAIFKK